MANASLKTCKKEEVNYKKNFCEKYFDKGSWDLDVLNQVDVLLKDKKGNILLYIESKYIIENETQHRQALAQVILTNKKQNLVLNKVALIYQDINSNDILEYIDCSDNSIMYNNDINWKSEKASSPTKDAVDRINDRIKSKITIFKNEEIKEFYSLLKTSQDIVIDITEKNFNVVYNQWKNEIKFKEDISDEQDLINLFLVDVLNNTKYKKKYYSPLLSDELTIDLIREGTNLNQYQLMPNHEGNIDGIKYSGSKVSNYYTIQDHDKYILFWKKYRRPPEENEFLKILEHSSSLYSDKYRSDTGGEYTPTCFVEKQNEILFKNYNMNDFIVFDPCAGVGNLENQFGKDYKQYCYLSTLEQMDVDICKIKGFDNAVKFDYVKNDEQPNFKYKGIFLDIREIAKREHRKLMVVMNPPYKGKGKKSDMAIDFFNKVQKLEPDVIVYYCKTEFFLRDTVRNFIESNYKIKTHIFSSAKTTFQLSDWMLSLVVFDKENGKELKRNAIAIDRYELDNTTEQLKFISSLNYNIEIPNLIKEIEKIIKKNEKGTRIGQWTNQSYCLVLSNRTETKNKITTENLKYCLFLKGLNFNTHPRYFETSNLIYRGYFENISSELFSDAIMFSLFYKGSLFTNKGQKNYIMPFTAEDIGCAKNDLNVLFANDEQQFSLFEQDKISKPFDFREFLLQFNFSKEAKDLYKAALQVFRYYHQNEDYQNKDWNDSFYDITNTIMGKDISSFQKLETENDTRITKIKTTKGSKGFGKNTIKYAVNSKYLPIFDNFFEVRDVLARKINKKSLEDGIILWERENIY